MKIKITPPKPQKPIREVILTEEEAKLVRVVFGIFNDEDFKNHLRKSLEYQGASGTTVNVADALASRMVDQLHDFV